jgi:hypothetical protein
MGPRAGLDGCGKSRLTGIRSPDRPARSESLYLLSYPGLEHLKTRNVLLFTVSAYGGWLFQPCAHNVSDLFGAFRILIPVPVSS